MNKIWDNKKGLERLGEQRDSVREEGKRLPFDCYNLRADGYRAYCSKFKKLGQSADGSLLLFAVLKGRRDPTCQDCPDFED